MDRINTAYVLRMNAENPNGFDVHVTRAFGDAPETKHFADYASAERYADSFGRGRYITVFACSIVGCDKRFVC